jgi:DNA-directed RNA polymerase subunit M/transcription elongation factor TFIIS
MSKSTADHSKAFWAKCGPCGHIWAAAYYPCDLAKFGRIIGRCGCPKCGERKRVFLAKQDNGTLLEPIPGGAA